MSDHQACTGEGQMTPTDSRATTLATLATLDALVALDALDSLPLDVLPSADIAVVISRTTRQRTPEVVAGDPMATIRRARRRAAASGGREVCVVSTRCTLGSRSPFFQWHINAVPGGGTSGTGGGGSSGTGGGGSSGTAGAGITGSSRGGGNQPQQQQKQQQRWRRHNSLLIFFWCVAGRHKHEACADIVRCLASTSPSQTTAVVMATVRSLMGLLDRLYAAHDLGARECFDGVMTAMARRPTCEYSVAAASRICKDGLPQLVDDPTPATRCVMFKAGKRLGSHTVPDGVGAGGVGEAAG